MEIIYRVYEVANRDEDFYGYHNDIILNQEVLCCENREQFKNIIKDMYAPKKVNFRNSKSLKNDDIYVIIISENCFNTKKYITVDDYTCSCCGRHFKANEETVHKMDLSRLIDICSQKVQENEKELMAMRFCSTGCCNKKHNELLAEYKEYAKNNNLLSDEWINVNSFDHNSGYIYMITKKSTGEFYVGQTKYVPIFRWGQHLKTERFDLKNIQDYVFEVLEICKNTSETLLEREAYWINKKRNENPKLSLNIVIPNEKQPTLFD